MPPCVQAAMCLRDRVLSDNAACVLTRCTACGWQRIYVVPLGWWDGPAPCPGCKRKEGR